MNFFKKLFVGLGCVFGIVCYGMLSLIVSASKGRHKPRRHRHGGFWKMLERMIVFSWFSEGVRKSRTRAETAYAYRTGQSLWREQKQGIELNTRRSTSVRSGRETKTADTVTASRKKATSASVRSKANRTVGISKQKKVPEGGHQCTVAQPVPVREKTELNEKENGVQAGTNAEFFAVNVPKHEEPKQKTAQEIEKEHQMQMKNLRLALLDEVKTIHAAPPEKGENDENGSPEKQLSLLLYQSDVSQKELDAALSRLRAERVRQQATYHGAAFADVFPVSLILADDDSERACIVDVGETGISYVIPWSSIPTELHELLKRYVSEAGGKLLGCCREELCNNSTNRMIVELYLGKQDETTSRILF